MKKLKLLTIFLISIVLVSCSSKPKYVFFMIGDGMGINSVFATEMYNEAIGDETPQLSFTSFPVLTVITTNSASSTVTCSAAAGTALSTGHKVKNGTIGIDSDGNPLRHITARAKNAGFGVGLVSSCGHNHATPASFVANVPSRNDYNKIVEQLLHSGVDISAAGGFFKEKKNPRTNEEFVAMAREAGMEVYAGKENFQNLKTSSRVMLLGNEPDAQELKFSIDQKDSDTKLEDFTRAAVDYLYDNYGKKGFFIMVEGGMTDHSCHSNDAATSLVEINDFDRNVQIALEFYKKHPKQTLIVVTADHETGSLNVGAGKYYSNLQYLACQKVSEDTLSVRLKSMEAQHPSWEDVKAVLSDNLGLWSTVEVSEKDEARFKELYNRQFVKKQNETVVAWYSNNSKLASEAVDYLNKKAGIGWGGTSHTGSPVGLWAIGAGAERFATCRDNTQVPQIICSLAGYAAE